MESYSNLLINTNKNNVLSNLIMKVRIYSDNKNCLKIYNMLRHERLLKKDDYCVFLIHNDDRENSISENGVLFKGYNSDGSMKALQHYTNISGKLKIVKEHINIPFISIDMYEENVFLYDYTKDSEFVSGYVLERRLHSNNTYQIIFTGQSVKIDLRNINKSKAYSELHSFVDEEILG